MEEHNKAKQNVVILAFAAVTVLFFTAFNPVAQIFMIIIWALFFFVTERFPMDVTALLIMAALMFTGLVTPQEGVSGFSNTATLTVLFMFIISAAIEKTGMVQRIAHKLFSLAKKSNFKQTGLLSLIIGPISGFINNTAAVAIFLPSVLSFSRKTHTPATKLLIPLSFMSMLGGMLTVFGTSTNILANDLLAANGFASFAVFDFFWFGLLGLAIGMVYFLLIGRFILPARYGVGTAHIEDSDKFLAELRIMHSSAYVGKTIGEADFGEEHQVEVLRLIRNGEAVDTLSPDTTIEAGDLLVIMASEADLVVLDQREHEQLVPNFRSANRASIQDGVLVKVLFRNPHLHYQSKSLSELNFYQRYGLFVVGLHRDREDIDQNQKFTDIQLRSGEVFLGKVAPAQLYRLRQSRDLMVLEEFENAPTSPSAWQTLAVLFVVIGLAVFNVVPLMVAALFGVLLLFLFRCISAEEIYNSVNWSVIFLLAGVIPLGIALQNTGAVAVLAGSITVLAQAVPPIVFLGILYLMTTLITEVISNNATVVLMFPIALSVALELGINPHAVALIIMFAASTSFLSPVGYQTNAMVYGAGEYRFSDFVKVGAPLNILLMVVLTTAIFYWY